MILHNDHLGTPQVLTDDNQTIVWQAEYDPFGQATVTTEMVTNNVRFPGQYFDEETGLYYNYFRTYDPSLGRYITSDLIGLSGGINTFGYVEGNPLTFSDPKGLCGLPCFIVPVVGACFLAHCTVNGTEICQAKYPDAQMLTADPDGLKFAQCLAEHVEFCATFGGLLSVPIGGAASIAGQEIGERIECGEGGCEDL